MIYYSFKLSINAIIWFQIEPHFTRWPHFKAICTHLRIRWIFWDQMVIFMESVGHIISCHSHCGQVSCILGTDGTFMDNIGPFCDQMNYLWKVWAILKPCCSSYGHVWGILRADEIKLLMSIFETGWEHLWTR